MCLSESHHIPCFIDILNLKDINYFQDKYFLVILGRMKRSFSIFFALYLMVGSIFPNMDFDQFSKIPQLLEHFNEHQQEAKASGEECSFIEFISMHLFFPNSHENDHHSHDSLPMQHLAFSAQWIVSPSPLFMIISQDNSYQEDGHYYLDFISSDFTSGLDHPPSILC